MGVERCRAVGVQGVGGDLSVCVSFVYICTPVSVYAVICSLVILNINRIIQ